ncbi:PQQ-binding-like beta-propeller repeat protein [Actinomycetes bacterium KLBMP 9759]
MQALRADDPRWVGPFELHGRLGAGGTGQVFLGSWPGGGLAAVKLVHAALARNPQFRTRFRNEVANVRQFGGPWAAPLIAADPEAPMPWLATAYVPGPSLERAVQTLGPLPGPTVLVMAAALAGALAEIHAAGLVHRDVKPSNVLLAADGPRLIDLGISRTTDATQLTSAGELIGTPAYMSPEQADGLDVGPASDVFSLGAVIAFAVSGYGPFGEGEAFVVLRRIVDDPPDVGMLTGPLREATLACLAKDPAARPSAAELARGLMPLTVPPGPGWLPGPLGTLDPTPPHLDRTSAHQVRPGSVLIPSGVPGRRPVGRRALLGGLAALGVAAATGGGIAYATSRPQPPSPVPTPVAAPGTSAPPQPAPGAAPASLWSVDTGVQHPGALIVTGDAVHVGGSGGVAVHDARTGARRWQFTAPEGGTGFDPDSVNLAVADGAVYLATRGAVTALDAATGAKKWAVPLTAATRYQSLVGPDVGAGGGTAFLTIGNTVTAVDPANGKTRWTYAVASNFANGPLVVGNRVLVPFEGSAALLELGTGAVVWEYATGEGRATKISVVDDSVYMCINGLAVTALELDTGKVRWQGDAGEGGADPKGAPAVADGVVSVLGFDEQVHALDMATGAERWVGPDRSAGGSTVQSATAAAAGVVYVGSNNGRFFALESATGKQLWSVTGKGGLNGVAQIAADPRQVVVIRSDGSMLAYGGK